MYKTLIYESRASNSFLSILSRYLGLTKPRIVLLLSLTGIIGYLIANRGHITLEIALLSLYIGYASSGGSMAINSYIDRDIDILMERTNKRASVAEISIQPAEKILIFGGFLVLSSLIVATFVFNVLTALLIAFGVFFYLIGYSIVLKRTTVWNTIIGGFASPLPVLVGYAAAQGNIPMEGFLLASLVFVWTPSHTWAMSTKHYEDYKKANIPMLPVVIGPEKSALVTYYWGIFVILYSYLLVYLFNIELWVMLILTLPNILFFYYFWKFKNDWSPESANTNFRAHNMWLAVAFITYLAFI